jgi:cellobiose phosphorylase
VWLGFFVCEVLREFAPLARRHGDEAFAQRCESERRSSASGSRPTPGTATGTAGAYFDDGTPLGSKDNVECRIDSIAQSWAVLSGIGPAERVARAMDSMAEHLVRPDAKLVQLLDPPFDRKGPEPRLHRRLRAGRARERRAVHAQRGVGDDGLRRHSATRSAPGG